MNKNRSCWISIIILSLLLVSNHVDSAAKASTDSKITNAQKSRVIANLATALKEKYVLVDEGKQIGDQFLKQDENSKFDPYQSRNEFLNRLNLKLRELANDLHLQVRSTQGERRRMTGSNRPPIEASILDGNVGLLTVNMLMGTEAAIHSSMQKLTKTDGLIIDVRQCPGGEFNIVRSLVSHFLPQDETIITYHTRGRAADVSKSHLPKGISRYEGKPVYVVTSAFTGSGCEELSFDLKYHNLAFTIGATTAGAGFGLSAEPVKLSNGFVAFIPDTNPVHPKYDGGFEKVGVSPDISTSSLIALDNAYQLILSQIYQANSDNKTVERALLESNLKSSAAIIKRAKNNRKYREYLGSYQDNKTISLDQGQLKLDGAAGMPLVLEANDTDLFTIKFTPGQMLKINRNEQRRVESISISSPQQKDWRTYTKLKSS